MTDSPVRTRGLRGLWRAARWSWQGLQAAWRSEASFRLEAILTAVLAPLGIAMGQTPVERVLLVGSWLLILAMELVNSAIETLIERYGPQQHPLAGRAKDFGSAAVFILIVNAVICWVCILLPEWWGSS